MNTGTAVMVGAMLGLLLAALIMLSTLMRYVASDMDGFRRWLDGMERP